MSVSEKIGMKSLDELITSFAEKEKKMRKQSKQIKIMPKNNNVGSFMGRRHR